MCRFVSQLTCNRAPTKTVAFSTVVTAETIPRHIATLDTDDVNLKTYLNEHEAAKEPLAGSYTFDTVPTLVRTPWEYERGKRPLSQWSRSTRSSNESSRGNNAAYFEKLPREVLHNIVYQLEALHDSDGLTCASCLQRDLCNISLVSKGWNRVAREHLFVPSFAYTVERTTI